MTNRFDPSNPPELGAHEGPLDEGEPNNEVPRAITGQIRLPTRIRALGKAVLKRSIKYSLLASPFLIALLIALVYELRSSYWQSIYLTRVAAETTYKVASGANPTPWFPKFGPYDERLGYTRIPRIIDNLVRNGFVITSQTRPSQRFMNLAHDGIYPPYREKTRAGITILDKNDTTIYSAYRPERTYESFDVIPDLVTRSLLHIENREILNPSYPTKNPAIEWDRLGLAVLEKLKQIIYPDLNAPGGSTIATQLEKYRHSNHGRTSGVLDKFNQMFSASLRAYMYGRDTLKRRRMIVLQYINSIPLAALRGYGEVSGLGDGLWAWYGLDFESTNQRLKKLSQLGPNEDPTPYAESYKQMLSLFIAHRRPSFYLINGLKDLNTLTNTHLDILANNNIISKKLRDACISIPLTLQRAAPKAKPVSFVQRKAANAIRTRLLELMNYPQLYDLDQADVIVKSTMDNEANEGVSNVLRQIKDAESVKKFGLSGARNLAKGDPSKVIYSITLYERVGNANLLRVQTDNFDNPFSINEGTRLDLGSTAKLRTLTTYLEIIGELFDRYSKMSPSDLKQISRRDLDPISIFVLVQFIKNPKLTLSSLLTLALQRRYSASPYETFFTGGGMHTFENFKHEDDAKNLTIQQALTHSINLPFIRLMRDLSRYYIARMGLRLTGNKADKKNSLRLHFLKKFADREGSYFLRRFYENHRGKPSKELLNGLIKGTRTSARHAAVMFRYVRPEASVDTMAAFLKEVLASTNISLELIDKWYREFKPGKFNLNDQGFLARIHPLELWLVKYLQDTPEATLESALAASSNERQQVYEWLFKTPRVKAQDSRIRTLQEVESFLEIHKQWQKMGYPFSSMVPSLASAIGSSGDRPVALAELVGIILNDGMRYPLVRLDELKLASETPYETNLRRVDNKTAGERVLKPEVAQALRGAMRSVVESGTARRVFHSFARSDGQFYTIGGKTGTGDHRYETFGAGGQLLSSRVVNRTATFAFYIGESFFGVVSAHVPGVEAAKFDFTSALAAELLKTVSGSLIPLIEASRTGLTTTFVEVKKEDLEVEGPPAAPYAPSSPKAGPGNILAPPT